MRRGVTLALAAALVLAMVGSLSTSARAAEELIAVNAWVTVGSTAPAVGCTVDVAVEVRDSSGPVSNADILLGLVVDGDVIDAPRAVTDETGIAFLNVNTSAAYEGADARIEVNIAGTYADRVAMTPTSDGACAGQDALISMQAEIWKPVAAAGDDTSTVAGDVGGGTVIPEVGFYVQQRNLSCEYASLYIATSAWYNPVSEYAFDEVVGWSPNPHQGYRGDITGWWGNTYDYGVYAEPLSWALSQFGFVGDAFYASGDPSALTSRLDAGIPTLVWLGLWGDTGYVDSYDGSAFTLVTGMHVVVAYGYDAGGVYISDPAIGGARYYDWDTFMWMWNVLDGMGLGVSPA